MPICYFAYLQFEAYFISPRIMQKAVAVPGAVAVISVIAGGSLLGVLGALIAIPTAAAIMLLVKEIFIVRQDKHYMTTAARVHERLSTSGVGVDRAVPVLRQSGRPGPASGRTSSTISLSTRPAYFSPTHRCLAPSTPTTRACGTTPNRSVAPAGWR